MPTSITLRDLTKSFAPRSRATPKASANVVDRVSLRIEPGEMFFLLGPSGCGKTTLLRMIAGFITPTLGTITFGDPPNSRDITTLPPNKRNTGMVFQSYALWPHMTVEANIAFGLRMRGVDRSERRARAAAALEMVQMAPYGSRKPNQLSGGQQQRVALARALVVRPDVLLLDEPLSNLDAKLRGDLRGEIRRICKSVRDNGNASTTSAMTTVYVTHDQKEALSMADRIAVMRAGRIVQIGTPSQLYKDPQTPFVAEFLGETNFVGGEVLANRSGGGNVAVETPLGILLAKPPTVPLSIGGGALCSFRPEAVRINLGQDSNRGGDNTFQGSVINSTYLGEAGQVSVSLEGGQVIRVTRPHPPTAELPAGTRVSVSIAAIDVTVFPRDRSV